jgi:hypothetical protein
VKPLRTACARCSHAISRHGPIASSGCTKCACPRWVARRCPLCNGFATGYNLSRLLPARSIECDVKRHKLTTCKVIPCYACAIWVLRRCWDLQNADAYMTRNREAK